MLERLKHLLKTLSVQTQLRLLISYHIPAVAKYLKIWLEPYPFLFLNMETKYLMKTDVQLNHFSAKSSNILTAYWLQIFMLFLPS